MQDNNEIYSYTEKGKKQEKKEEIKARRKLEGKRPLWRTVVLWILTIVFTVSGCGMIYYYRILGNIGFQAISEKNHYTNDANSNISSEIYKNQTTTLDLFDGVLLNDPKILNIMIFGED